MGVLKDGGGIFLDVGAAQGRYSILGAVAGCEVYAVEPDPMSVKALNTNRTLNGLGDKLHICQVALGDKENTSELYYDKKGVQAASLIKSETPEFTPVRVDVKPLDSLISLGAIPVPRVIKIDVEGAEAWVIKGMLSLLSSPVPAKPQHLFLEIHPSRLIRLGSSNQEVINMVQGCDYKLANVWPRGTEHLCHYVSV